MPIYEYKCLSCKEDFETLVFGSKDKVICPNCKGDKLERLMSCFGFKSGGNEGSRSYTPASGSSGCASCSSGSCSTCH